LFQECEVALPFATIAPRFYHHDPLTSYNLSNDS
jgi:hypothetical protein